MKKILYFDCSSGASGDMILSALLDLTGTFDDFTNAMLSFPINGLKIDIERTERHHIGCVKLTVSHGPQPLRHRSDLAQLISDSPFSTWVKERSLDVIDRLALAEAKVHQTDPEHIHFHEIGAADTLVDCVGTFFLLEQLGKPDCFASALNVGQGTVKTEHGLLPVPAPATAELLAGVPIYTTDEIGELVTPTGAALLTSVVQRFGPLPTMVLKRTGLGAGHREGKHLPNIVRIFMGNVDGEGTSEELLVLECTIDDMNPENYGFVMDRLLEAGARDVLLHNVQMKKSRPGIIMSVLADLHRKAALTQIIFRETTTLGIRSHRVERNSLDRRFISVLVEGHPVSVKVAILDGEVLGVHPEYEDCRAIAHEHGTALRRVQEMAIREARQTIAKTRSTDQTQT